MYDSVQLTKEDMFNTDQNCCIEKDMENAPGSDILIEIINEI